MKKWGDWPDGNRKYVLRGGEGAKLAEKQRQVTRDLEYQGKS